MKDAWAGNPETDKHWAEESERNMNDAEAMSYDEIRELALEFPDSETGNLGAGDPVWAGIATLDDGSAVGVETNTYGQTGAYRFYNAALAEEWLEGIADSLA